MTVPVSLLFIIMIPIDCNITNFPLHLFAGNLVTSHWSATSKMTIDIIFTDATPINQQKFLCARILWICHCLPCYTALEYEKYFFLPQWKYE